MSAVGEERRGHPRGAGKVSVLAPSLARGLWNWREKASFSFSDWHSEQLLKDVQEAGMGIWLLSDVGFSSPLTHSVHRWLAGYLKVHHLKQDLFKPTEVKWRLMSRSLSLHSTCVCVRVCVCRLVFCTGQFLSSTSLPVPRAAWKRLLRELWKGLTGWASRFYLP